MPEPAPSLNTLKFPLLWHGRVILLSESPTSRQDIHQTFYAMGLTLEALVPGSTSSGGRYCTWQVSAHIPSLEHFRAVNKALSQLPGVKMIL